MYDEILDLPRIGTSPIASDIGRGAKSISVAMALAAINCFYGKIHIAFGLISRE